MGAAASYSAVRLEAQLLRQAKIPALHTQNLQRRSGAEGVELSLHSSDHDLYLILPRIWIDQHRLLAVCTAEEVRERGADLANQRHALGQPKPKRFVGLVVKKLLDDC